MPSTPQVATLTQTPVTWSDGSLFNGFLLLGLVVPYSNSSDWVEIDLGGRSPGERIPIFLKVPIVDGIYDNSVGVLYNSSLAPPSTQYAAWWYDSATRARWIAGPTALFTVSTPILTPPATTLTLPTPGTVPPTPNDDPDAGGPVMPSGYYVITYTPNITPDLANSAVQACTATGNVVLENPVLTTGDLVPGMTLSYLHKQDNTGGRQLTFGSDYVGVTDQEPTLDPNTYTIYNLRYNPDLNWELVSLVKGLL